MQQTRTRTIALIAASVVIAAVAIGLVSMAGSLGGDDSSGGSPKQPAATGPTTVDVQLSDFKIKPSQATVPAGKVTFEAKNAGDEEHEMVVVRTDKAAGSLAKGGEASEAGAVGEIPEFDAGKTERKAFNLKPGRYVLLCNVPGHYKAGMYTTFTVR